MAESHDGRGILIFGGFSIESFNENSLLLGSGFSDYNGYEDRILELRIGSNSWNTSNITLKNGRNKHVVIPFK